MAPTKVQREFAQSVAMLFEKVLSHKDGMGAVSSPDWKKRSKGERSGWLKVVSFVKAVAVREVMGDDRLPGVKTSLKGKKAKSTAGKSKLKTKVKSKK